MLLDGYRIGKKIGTGYSGHVYQATRIADNNNTVAIKMQSDREDSFIDKEYTIYQSLKGGHGIPAVIEFGTYEDRLWISMELLGDSLNKLLISCGNHFSLKTVLMLADQIIDRLEFIHSRNVVHGDIKLDNILMGIGDKSNLVYLIDFGLSSPIRNEEKLATDEDNGSFPDNIMNCSPKNKSSSIKRYDVPQGRNDDLLALGFSLMSTFPKPAADKMSSAPNVKKSTSYLENICSPHPGEFLTYMEYCMGLAKDQVPDYSYLRKLFKDLFDREQFVFDFVYDWTRKE